MLADLDLLLIAVFCTADDLLPQRAKNARRMLTDAEVVTLCVAQAIMGIPSDQRFLAVARKRLAHLFPVLPNRPGYHKRRDKLSDTIEALIAVFARDSPGYHDDLLLVDPTPVACARSIETTQRSQLADAADDGDVAVPFAAGEHGETDVAFGGLRRGERERARGAVECEQAV